MEPNSPRNSRGASDFGSKGLLRGGAAEEVEEDDGLGLTLAGTVGKRRLRTEQLRQRHAEQGQATKS